MIQLIDYELNPACRQTFGIESLLPLQNGNGTTPL